jgi:hypothetical protein
VVARTARSTAGNPSQDSSRDVPARNLTAIARARQGGGRRRRGAALLATALLCVSAAAATTTSPPPFALRRPPGLKPVLVTRHARKATAKAVRETGDMPASHGTPACACAFVCRMERSECMSVIAGRGGSAHMALRAQATLTRACVPGSTSMPHVVFSVSATTTGFSSTRESRAGEEEEGKGAAAEATADDADGAEQGGDVMEDEGLAEDDVPQEGADDFSVQEQMVRLGLPVSFGLGGHSRGKKRKQKNTNPQQPGSAVSGAKGEEGSGMLVEVGGGVGTEEEEREREREKEQNARAPRTTSYCRCCKKECCKSKNARKKRKCSC